MQVFINGQWHTPEDAPIVVRLTPIDRQAILSQPSVARFFVQSDPDELKEEVDIYVREAIEIYEEDNPEETEQYNKSGGPHGKLETANILPTLQNGTDLTVALDGHPLKHHAMLKRATEKTPSFRLSLLLTASEIAKEEGEQLVSKALEELAKRLDKQLYEAQQAPKGKPTSDKVN